MATLAQNIQRAINDFNSIENAIVQKGVPVPDGTPTSEYGEKILSIETGVDTSGDTVVPSALREGYTAHDAAGQEITGTIPNYDGGDTVELTSPEGATLNTAGTYCEGNIEVVPKLQSKTATTGEIVTADAGYVGLESVDTNPVFEAGKKSEYDAFWDAYQNNGNRDHYQHGFAGLGWTYKNFYPKYSMIPKYAVGMFEQSRVVDIYSRLDEKNLVLDLSECTQITNVFYAAYAEHLRRIDIRKGQDAGNLFSYSRIATIEALVVDESVSYRTCFVKSNALTNLTIEGTIGKNGFDVSWSPLSKASIISIVNALSDTTTGLTVTLRLAAVNTAFETTAGAADGSTSEEWTALIATKPNWTINLINS